MPYLKHALVWAAIILVLPALFACGCKKKSDLVLYMAGNKVFSEHILSEFKEETGIEVVIASDTEITRGVGLRTRIFKEKSNPQADVYWNNEVANTIVLQQEGCLIPYKSPSADEIPSEFKDPQGYWTAFGARARVFIVNTDLVTPNQMPTSMYDMLKPEWKGKVGISIITGGTTATHAAALFELLGEEDAKKFYHDLKGNGVVICNGNGHVKDLVADGELAWGWTDTNDCNIALKQGKPVKVVYPDQGENQIGTYLIPHSVSIVKGGPNPENAKKFVDFLLRKETERKLAHGPSVQIPVRPGIETPKEAEKNFIMDINKIRNFNKKTKFADVAKRLSMVIKYMEQNFNR